MDNASHIAVGCFGVSKAFGEGDARTDVLRALDLTVDAGSLTLLVGPSGCGKTTLISIIAGMLSADDGRIEVFGTVVNDLERYALHRFRRRMIGFVFQRSNLFPALSAVENTAVPLILLGMSKPQAYELAEARLDQLGLGAHLYKYPDELSGGQQQRIAIARALIHSPRLVVCDEPTASLDAEAGQTVMKLLRDAALESARAVVVVTHDSRTFPFADRIVQMRNGRIEVNEAAHG